MKSNFLINSLKGGGTEKVCTLISNELVNKGWEVNLYVLDDGGCNYYLDERVNIQYLGRANTLKSVPKIFNLLKRENIDKIFIYNHELALATLFSQLFLRKKIFLISRINNTLSKTIAHKNFKYRIFVNFFMRYFYRYIDFHVFQSNGIRDDMVNNYNIRNNFIVINNPVKQTDVTLIKNKAHKNKLLYVGRLVPQKNVIDILKSIKIIVDEGFEIELDVVGEGPQYDFLKKYCDDNNISNNVIFHGYQKNVVDYFKSTNLTLLSSFNEGFPNVLLESLSYRTPVISYDCPSGPSEIIINGINGFLVPYLDVKELAIAIKAGLNFQWDNDEIDKSIIKFSIQNIIQKYESVLNMTE